MSEARMNPFLPIPDSYRQLFLYASWRPIAHRGAGYTYCPVGEEILRDDEMHALLVAEAIHNMNTVAAKELPGHIDLDRYAPHLRFETCEWMRSTDCPTAWVCRAEIVWKDEASHIAAKLTRLVAQKTAP